jgi:hypothetical protein
MLYHNAFVSAPFVMTLTLKNNDLEQDITIHANEAIVDLSVPVEGIVEVRLKSLEGDMPDEARHRLTLYLKTAT